MNRYSVFIKSIAFVLSLCVVTVSQARELVDSSFGVSYSPPNYPAVTLEDYQQGFRETLAVGTHVSYLYAWSGGDEEFAVTSMVMDTAKSLGITTLLQFSSTSIGFPDPPDKTVTPVSFNNPDVRTAYLDDVRRLAEIKPDYLVLVAEINLMYFLHWQEYEYYKTLYTQAYDLVKSISPTTQVGVSYHMDIFFGDEEYALYYDLGPQDFIGFTSYPSHLVYDGYTTSIATFPVEYYSRIRIVFPEIPVLFTEIGWPSAGDGSLEDQAEFIRRLPELLRDVNPVLISWALLHDVNYFQLFMLNDEQLAIMAKYNVDPVLLFDELNSMGLMQQWGPPKPGWLDAVKLDFSAVVP